MHACVSYTCTTLPPILTQIQEATRSIKHWKIQVNRTKPGSMGGGTIYIYICIYIYIGSAASLYTHITPSHIYTDVRVCERERHASSRQNRACSTLLHAVQLERASKAKLGCQQRKAEHRAPDSENPTGICGALRRSSQTLAYCHT